MSLWSLLLCLFCLVTLVACAPPWKRRPGAQEIEAELSQYFPQYNEFSAVQKILEDSRRRRIDKYMLDFTAATKRKILHTDTWNKTWMRKDKTEAGQNAKVDDFLLEGDIVPTVDLLHDIGMTDESDGIRRQPGFLWELAVVFYSISTEIKQSPEHLAAVRAGIDFWHSHSCVDFHEIDGEMVDDGLLFFKGLGCYSFIGRLGGPQGISIGEGCEHSGIVQHEIGHALGLAHQQSRADRDDYVDIIPSNIDPYSYINFNKYPLSTSQFSHLPYDYGSVMHFGPRNFAIDGNQPTIKAHDRRYQEVIGQRIGASFIDVAQVNQEYQCLRQCNFDYSYNIPSCNHGGIVDWRSYCSKCICPDGFGGTTCNEVEPSSDVACGDTLEAQNKWSVLDVSFKGSVKCVWHITSPTGAITMKMLDSGFNFPCHDGCTLGYIEVKIGPDFRAAGPRSCCQASTSTYRTAEPIIVIVRLEEKIDAHFQLKYRSA